MKYVVYNDSEYFGDRTPQYFDTLEEAEAKREEIIEFLIELHREEALREFWDSEDGRTEIANIEEQVINDGLRQEAKEAICIEEEESEND